MIDSILPFLIVFTAMFALDYVWIFYTKAIQRHAPFAASSWVVAITVFNGLAQIGYVNDHWLLIPAVAGAFGGTYVAMKFGKR